VADEPATTQHLRDLALLRRVRDRIDREYAQPLDVEALARGAHMSAGHLSRQFRLAYATELVGVPPSVYRRDAERATVGMPACVAKQVTRPIRNQEAPMAGRA